MTDSPSETLKSAMNNKGFTVTTSGCYIFHQANVILNPPNNGKICHEPPKLFIQILVNPRE